MWMQSSSLVEGRNSPMPTFHIYRETVSRGDAPQASPTFLSDLFEAIMDLDAVSITHCRK